MLDTTYDHLEGISEWYLSALWLADAFSVAILLAESTIC